MSAVVYPDFNRGRPHNPPMNMKMLKITRTKDLVRFRHEVTIDAGGLEERDVIAHEAPLKKFDDTMQALAAVVAKQLETGPDWAKGITVFSLGLSYTKHGTRSATIYFTKGLDATSTQHSLATPAFQIDDGAKGEDSRRQCPPTHAQLVIDMIKRAEDYANGKRQQMQLPLQTEAERKKAEGEKAGETGTLKFPAGSAGAGD